MSILSIKWWVYKQKMCVTGEFLNVAVYFYEPSVKKLQKNIWYILINIFSIFLPKKFIHR